MTRILPGFAPDFKIVVGSETLRMGQTIDVISVSVTDVNDGADSFTFMLQDRRPERDRLSASGEKLKWMDSDAFQEGKEVTIHMGYVNQLALMLRGRVKAYSVDFPEGGQPILQVEGYSLYHDLQQQRTRTPFATSSESDIASKLAREMGLQYVGDASPFKRSMVSPAGDTFAEILERLARRVDYEVVVKDRTLYFQKPRYKKSLSPAMTFEWGRDLRSFSARLTTHDMVSKVTCRASTTAQGQGRAAVVGDAKAGSERGKMGKQSASQVAERVHPAKGEDGRLFLSLHDAQTQQEAAELARAELERRSLGLITARASLAGDTRVRAGLVVEMVGLGKRFSGIYYITSATHTIDTGGYRTDFEMKRNAL